MFRHTYAVATIVTLAFAGIVLAETPVTSKPVTFNKHIAPIIFESCAHCHRPGEAAPFNLLNYTDVKQRAKFIAEITESRVMPPWHAKQGYGDFANDRSISDEKIALIRQWVDQGAVEGDPADLPSLPTFVDGWQLGRPDVVVQMAEAFTVPASGPDIYRNFVVPVTVPEGKYLKAIEFRPSARSVTHHSLFAIDTEGECRKLDEQQPGPGFSGMGFRGARQNVQGIGGWAVGGTPKAFPDGIAIPLPPTFDLILQSHFHPTGKEEQEQSVVGLFLTDTPPTRKMVPVQLPVFFGAIKGIDIPAGEKDYTITESFKLPVDVNVTGLSGHAHYICSQMKATATLPNGTEIPLLWIDDWNFAWQEEYRYKKELPLPAGTVINASIHYDNSAENPSNPNDPPQRIAWGRESTDEMGSITVMMIPQSRSDEAALEKARRSLTLRSLLESKSNPGGRRGAMRERIIQRFDDDKDGKLNEEEMERATDAVGSFLGRAGFSQFGEQ